MLTAKEIRELIQGKLDDITALMKLAEADDNRGLTEKEQAVIDGLLAEIGTRAVDGKPATGMYHDYDQAERYESIRDDLGSHRTEPVTPVVGGDKPVVPSNLRGHGSLKSYHGQDAELNAYRAGQFFAATIFGSSKADQWCRENGVYAAQSEGDNSLGGYLVPIETEASIITLREQRGIFRQYAEIQQMGSDTKTIPRKLTGITAYWGSEGAAITASDNSLDEVKLITDDLSALIYYSTQLNDDSLISIGDDLTKDIAYAFADKEDEAGFNGDGTSTYGGNVGVMNAMNAGSIYTAASGNTAFSTLDLADFEGIIGQLPDYGEDGAAWFISKVGYYQSMARLMDAGGGNTIETLGDGTRRKMFMGYPVVFSQVLNKVTAAQTSTNILAFGDLALTAALGNRQETRVMISEHYRFANNQLAIRGTSRVAINVHETGTASAASSMIVLATPGS